jgi:hypothetical protein
MHRSKSSRRRKNPFGLSILEMVWLGSMTAGAGAIVYGVASAGPASAGSGSTGSTGATGASASKKPPFTLPPEGMPHFTTLHPGSGGATTAAPPGTPTGATTAYTATNTSSGQTFNLAVGNTLTILLSLTAPITAYVPNITGDTSALTEGAQTDLTDQTFQVWTATTAGSATLTYQGQAGNSPSGSPLTFNVTVA